MRLRLISCPGHGHLASAVTWTSALSSNIYTCSDDQSVQKWSPQGLNMGKACATGKSGLHHCCSARVPEPLSRHLSLLSNMQVCALESSVTDLHCNPSGPKKQQGSTELFAVACADGEWVVFGDSRETDKVRQNNPEGLSQLPAVGLLKLIHSNGKIEKAAEAHSGAVLCVRWSPDGELHWACKHHHTFYSAAALMKSRLQAKDTKGCGFVCCNGATSADMLCPVAPPACPRCSCAHVCMQATLLQHQERMVRLKSGQKQACCAQQSWKQRIQCTA